MSLVIKTAGVALCAVAVIQLVKPMRPELSALISALVCAVLAAAAFPSLSLALSRISPLLSQSSFSGYTEPLLKSLGVAFISHAASEVCRDSGETALASKIEFAASAALLLIALPVAEELLAVALNPAG